MMCSRAGLRLSLPVSAMFRSLVRIAVAASFAGTVFSARALVAQSPNGGATTFPPSLITSGQGEAKATPDRVSVSVNVQTRATTAVAAATENSQRTRAVLDALGKLGLSKDQLSTEGYSAYPELQYDRDGGNPRVTGY